MMRDAPKGPVRIAIAVADRSLSDRLADLLSGIDGIALVVDSAEADVRLVPATGEPVRGEADPSLTPREQEVLALLAEGASNKEIARRLGISAHTAKFHVGSLMDKLDAVTRTDALAHAVRKGVIEL